MNDSMPLLRSFHSGEGVGGLERAGLPLITTFPTFRKGLLLLDISLHDVQTKQHCPFSLEGNFGWRGVAVWQNRSGPEERATGLP